MSITKKIFKSWWRGLTRDPSSMFVGPKIVVIGGGTGLATLLRGLKKYSNSITAIVTMCDDGSSTGRLREELGVLPPGDIRKCLAALAEEEPLLTKLFEYRFQNGNGLAGHSFGNLFLAALENLTGSFEKAIEEASNVLAISGRVMPSTLDNLTLGAELTNKKIIWGESQIPQHAHKNPIKNLIISPKDAKAYPPALDAIKNADLIVIGPGSLYTSIIPNFLIKGISEAISASSSPKIYICNISTERGETEGFEVEDHLDKIISYGKEKICNAVLVNSKLLRKEQEGELGKIKNITTQKNKIGRYHIHKFDLVDESKPLYHDSAKLARAIISIFNKNNK